MCGGEHGRSALRHSTAFPKNEIFNSLRYPAISKTPLRLNVSPNLVRLSLTIVACAAVDSIIPFNNSDVGQNVWKLCPIEYILVKDGVKFLHGIIQMDSPKCEYGRPCGNLKLLLLE